MLQIALSATRAWREAEHTPWTCILENARWRPDDDIIDMIRRLGGNNNN